MSAAGWQETEITVSTIPVREALSLISSGGCERLTSGDFACHHEPGWSPYAAERSGRWCDACIAKAALNGLDAAEIQRRRKV